MPIEKRRERVPEPSREDDAPLCENPFLLRALAHLDASRRRHLGLPASGPVDATHAQALLRRLGLGGGRLAWPDVRRAVDLLRTMLARADGRA